MLGTNGVSGTSASSAEAMGVLAPAIQALFEATPTVNGRKALDIAELGPYLTTDEQKAVYEKLMRDRERTSR
jgi:hypothetical protein